MQADWGKKMVGQNGKTNSQSHYMNIIESSEKVLKNDQLIFRKNWIETLSILDWKFWNLQMKMILIYKFDFNIWLKSQKISSKS